MRRVLDSKLIHYKGPVVFWPKTVPLKVRSFVWRADLSRIHVAIELSERGVKVPNQMCHLCNKALESVDHLLVSCEFAMGVFECVFKWCGIRTQQFSKVSEVINFAASWGNCPRKRTIVSTILFCLLWNIWRAMNDRVFKDLKTSYTKVADNIISLSFLWCNHRSSNGCGSWVDWCCSSFLHLTNVVL
ncbi:hypothetical protein Lser_V15G14863 [Lactuca serriola]